MSGISNNNAEDLTAGLQAMSTSLITVPPGIPAGNETETVSTTQSLSQNPDLPPPAYDSTVRLRCTTSVNTIRYEKSPLARYPAHVPIVAGLYAILAPITTPVPAGWFEYFHPEGQNYFYNRDRRIVTEANLRDESKLRLVLQGAALVDQTRTTNLIPIPDTAELFLEIDREEANVVKYFFVDHLRQTEFWLVPTTTDKLDLPPVTSMTHLQVLLKQHYWNHVELFPMHIALPPSVEEQLLGILGHCCIDGMTSELSTVPYTQSQCEAFVKMIQSIPAESPRSDGYRNCIMARLWSEISGNYFVNLHGETDARLSRNQRLLAPPDVQESAMMNFAFVVCFNAPSRLYERLCEQWIDKIAYASHWRSFMRGLVEEWRQMILASLGLLLSSCAIFGMSLALRNTSPILVLALQTTSMLSIFFCVTSISSALLLTRSYSHHAEAHASDAVDFLESSSHESFGLQPLALLLCLPWSNFLWAFCSLGASVIMLSSTIPSAILQIFLWICIFFVALSATVVVVFMRNGGGSLTGTRLKTYFEQSRFPLKHLPALWSKLGAVARLLGRVRWRRRESGFVPLRQHDGSEV